MKKNSIAGILAILLGSFGLHKFFLGQWKSGLLYLIFFWTGVPGLLGVIDGVRLLMYSENIEE